MGKARKRPDFQREIEGAYTAMDCFHAECQNETDIRAWLEDKMISEEECKALRKLNKVMFERYND